MLHKGRALQVVEVINARLITGLDQVSIGLQLHQHNGVGVRGVGLAGRARAEHDERDIGALDAGDGDGVRRTAQSEVRAVKHVAANSGINRVHAAFRLVARIHRIGSLLTDSASDEGGAAHRLHWRVKVDGDAVRIDAHRAARHAISEVVVIVTEHTVGNVACRQPLFVGKVRDREAAAG